MPNPASISSAQWSPFERQWITVGGEKTSYDFFALSYNILHEATLDPNDNNQPYLVDQPDLVSSTFRNDRIIREIQEWGPDLVALQEMDVQYFGTQWLPKMTCMGYAGHLAIPIGPNTNGSVALFYKHEVFELKSVECCPMEELINEQLPHLRRQFEIVRDPKISGRVVNFARLRHRATKRDIQVACVHFLWNCFEGPLYQCLEVLATLKKVSHLAKDDPFLILGDFNHRPSDPQYELLAAGCVSTKTMGLLAPEIQKDEPLLSKMVTDELQHSFPLRSSYVEVQGEEPAVTSFSFDDGQWWEVALDYIWFSSGCNLEVNGVMQLPDKEALGRYGATPSPLFPSDHLPVGARFSFI